MICSLGTFSVNPLENSDGNLNPGSYLRKKDNCFLLKNEDKVFEVSAKKSRN